MMRITILATALALAAVPTALAWGSAGHEIAATIAQIHLPRPVLALVCDILHPELNLSSPVARAAAADPPCSLPSIAAWADKIKGQPHYRYTAPMHYVNAVDDAPPDECAFPGTHGWQGRETSNVLAALGNATNVLRDFAKGERRVDAAEEALKFFVHYMGDLHQPLHSSGREKGGNGARVTWNGRVTNLHSVWDGLLIAQSIRTTPQNYSRPLTGSAGAFVEPHLRGAIYDPYIRRIMHEGLSVGGRLDEESRAWLDCPTPAPDASASASSVDAQVLLAPDWAGALGLTTRAGAEKGWDDAVLCPYAWAKPIHELNCALPVWPHELDLPGSHPSAAGPHADVDANAAGRRPPRHPELLELDTPAYAGRIAKEWVVERMLAMAGVRMAGVLTDVLAEVAGDRYA